MGLNNVNGSVCFTYWTSKKCILFVACKIAKLYAVFSILKLYGFITTACIYIFCLYVFKIITTYLLLLQYR